MEGSGAVYARVDAAVSGAEAFEAGAGARGAASPFRPSGAAGVASRAVERHHFGSGEIDVGMLGARVRGRRRAGDGTLSPGELSSPYATERDLSPAVAAGGTAAAEDTPAGRPRRRMQAEVDEIVFGRKHSARGDRAPRRDR